MNYRILVVDDYESWRRYLHSAVQTDPQWQIVGESSDGLDAVYQAVALRPDLVLLDVGLPTLNGVAAARRIVAHNPDTRVLFLSENPSWDIVEAAFGAGGAAYVLKSDAGEELLPAMDAVINGRRFVSTGLKRHALLTREAQVPVERIRHAAGFYADDAALMHEYVQFSASMLTAGKTVIVLGLDSRQRSLEQQLEASGLDIARLTKDGRYRWMSVADTLRKIIVDDSLDEARFWKVLPPIVVDAARASTAAPRATALWGECAPTLWRTGNAMAAIRLEQLWDELAQMYDVETLCAYPAAGFAGSDARSAFENICAAHSSSHSG